MFSLDIETSGLHPDKGDIITCIGVMSEHGITQFTSPSSLFRSNPLSAEFQIITDFLRSALPQGEMLTYNGTTFDIPFIQTRCIEHGLTKDSPLPLSDIQHLDLSRFVRVVSESTRYISKDDAARRFANIYIPSNSAGLYLARIYKNRLVTEEEHIDMLQHNAIDLAATYKFALREMLFPDYQEWSHNELLGKAQPKTKGENNGEWKRSED